MLAKNSLFSYLLALVAVIGAVRANELPLDGPRNDILNNKQEAPVLPAPLNLNPPQDGSRSTRLDSPALSNVLPSILDSLKQDASRGLDVNSTHLPPTTAAPIPTINKEPEQNSTKVENKAPLHKFCDYLKPICNATDKITPKQVTRVQSQLKSFVQMTNGKLGNCFLEHYSFDPLMMQVNKEDLVNICASKNLPVDQRNSYKSFENCALKNWDPSVDKELDKIQVARENCIKNHKHHNNNGTSPDLSGSKTTIGNDDEDDIALFAELDKAAAENGAMMNNSSDVKNLNSTIGQLAQSTPKPLMSSSDPLNFNTTTEAPNSRNLGFNGTAPPMPPMEDPNNRSKNLTDESKISFPSMSRNNENRTVDSTIQVPSLGISNATLDQLKHLNYISSKSTPSSPSMKPMPITTEAPHNKTTTKAPEMKGESQEDAQSRGILTSLLQKAAPKPKDILNSLIGKDSEKKTDILKSLVPSFLHLGGDNKEKEKEKDKDKKDKDKKPDLLHHLLSGLSRSEDSQSSNSTRNDLIDKLQSLNSTPAPENRSSHSTASPTTTGKPQQMPTTTKQPTAKPQTTTTGKPSPIETIEQLLKRQEKEKEEFEMRLKQERERILGQFHKKQPEQEGDKRSGNHNHDNDSRMHQLEHDRQMSIDPIGHTLKHQQYEMNRQHRMMGGK